MSKANRTGRYVRQCYRKRPYDTREDAEAAIENIASYGRLKYEVESYLCRHCGKWHFGRPRPETVR